MTMSEHKTSFKLPVLDLSQSIEISSLSTLYKACQEWGFFYIINHGISKNLFDEVCSCSKQIFSIPLDSKLKLGPSSCLKTYTPRFIASPYFESLRVSGPDFFASAKSSADVLFSQQKCEFRKFYDSEFSNCHGYLRIVNYSPPKNVEEKEVEGLGMHTDMSCITILYQDETGGLQMRSRQGEWMDICPCENALVVNVGDMMQAWSNGQLRSSEHRVILKRFVNRLSLAFFWCFEDEKVISAPDDIIGEENLRLYKPFVCLDYLKFRENNEEGKFDKIGCTVNDFAGLKLAVILDKKL
ncbi:gibberellin 20-oxidase-like protein isoform X2 [Hevea brasiliensis]|uniref:gibberellin 20-oxidase-like protein isoform X2 n=1 Tax=Hevea brasiliensis TaxID=3981 RepID=UPI0025E9D0A4|nr:gibberellin 20-oxidase-like protein isoform X2 [Hevea brasiliensis]